MMNHVESELKAGIKAAGLTLRDIAIALNQPYTSVAGRLNGFTPLSIEDRRKILKIIEESKLKKERG